MKYPSLVGVCIVTWHVMSSGQPVFPFLCGHLTLGSISVKRVAIQKHLTAVHFGKWYSEKFLFPPLSALSLRRACFPISWRVAKRLSQSELAKVFVLTYWSGYFQENSCHVRTCCFGRECLVKPAELVDRLWDLTLRCLAITCTLRWPQWWRKASRMILARNGLHGKVFSRLNCGNGGGNRFYRFHHVSSCKLATCWEYLIRFYCGSQLSNITGIFC